MDAQAASDTLSARLLSLAQAHVSRLTVRFPKGKGLCCFHEEDTPSLSFDFSKGVFHCFGCGKGGGVKDFALAVGAPWGTIRHSPRERARFAVQTRRRQAEEQARAILQQRKDERDKTLWAVWFDANTEANSAAELLALFSRRPDLADEFSELATRAEREYGEAVSRRAVLEAQLGERDGGGAVTTTSFEDDPIAYLSGLSDELEPRQKQEELKILRTTLADLYVTDRALFAVAATLVKEKLGIGRTDLVAGIKPLVNTEGAAESKPLPIARFPELVDLVEDDGEVQFLVRIGDNGSGLKIETEWQIDEQLYIPPSKILIPWLLPQAENVLAAYESDDPANLYADLVTYYKNLSELPTATHYDLLTAFTFHTYILDFPEVTHSPELVFDAVPERGKSRTGKAMSHVAMRALRTETLREANIFRWSEDLGATLFFDVLNLWKKAEREKSEDILLNRFEKGARAARVLYPEKGRFEDTRYFDIFGATIIATNESVHKIMDTRCLTISMPPAKKRYDTEPTPELGLPLRERLVAWRAHRMGKMLPEMKKPFSGRFGDITLPLLKIIRIVAPKREETLLKLFADMEKGRLNEKSRTLEGDILTALLGLDAEVSNGKLALKKLVEKLNEERADKEKVTPRFVSPRLRSLGFQLTNRNPADIVWNQELLEQCLIAYGIKEPPPPSETSSQSSQHSQSSQAGTEKAEEKSGNHESVETNESVERQNAEGRREYQFTEETLSDAEVFE